MKRQSKRIFSISCFLLLFASCNNVGKSQFEKIIFHTTRCFGACPIFHLELNKDKKVRLYAESVSISEENWKKDTSKTGYFEGEVSDSTFQKLSSIIKSIGIDTLTFRHELCCDGSVYTIIVYRNGERKFLQSMFPPAKAGPLIGTLFQICEGSHLTRSSKPFKIESDHNPLSLPVRFPPEDSTKKDR